jgi:2-polyprenyl-6-methoxyphenol hydroxylase-like FAD-dependent oxidoreductase
VPDAKAHLAAAFAGWADPVPAMLANTPADHVIHADIIDRPTARTWSKGRVGLVGDAIHPTTPNLGQGGCMAIEDSVVLARHFATEKEPVRALEAFAAEREPRTSGIVNESWKFGKLAQMEGAVACWLRDAAFGMIGRLLGPGRFLKHARFDIGPLPARAS